MNSVAWFSRKPQDSKAFEFFWQNLALVGKKTKDINFSLKYFQLFFVLVKVRYFIPISVDTRLKLSQKKIFKVKLKFCRNFIFARTRKSTKAWLLLILWSFVSALHNLESVYNWICIIFYSNDWNKYSRSDKRWPIRTARKHSIWVFASFILRRECYILLQLP